MATPVVTDWNDLPVLLTMQHVREITGLSRDLTYQLPHRKGFPVVKFGWNLRVLRDGLRKWLEEQSAGDEYDD